jgi:hypothetical protein
MSKNRYSPVGVCIYCGSTQPPLSDEHVIAYGLDGGDILPDASCKVCAAITSKVERHCLQKLFMPARFHLKQRSRKGLPKTLPVEAVISGLKTNRELTAAEHPGMLWSWALEPPYILDGLEPMGLRRGGRVAMRALNNDNNERLNKLGDITLPASFDVTIFARMIAKIAHAYAIAQRGLNGFRPLALEAILADDPSDIWYVVGGRSKPLPGNDFHRLSIEEREVITRDFRRKILLVVLVQLFADFDMPAHEVVVGEL